MQDDLSVYNMNSFKSVLTLHVNLQYKHMILYVAVNAATLSNMHGNFHPFRSPYVHASLTKFPANTFWV